MSTVDFWNSLSKPWRVCAELAWEAYCAGSLPIASIVVNEEGRIVSSGRNRIHEPPSPPQLAGHPLAHAEMNALVSFDYAQHNPYTSVLYTSTEPCPLCMGAIRMAGVRTFHFASRDPWAGCSAMTEQVPYLREKKIRGVPPQSADLERVLIALQIESHLRRNTPKGNPQFIEVYRCELPKATEVGERLYQTGRLRILAEEKVGAEEVVNLLHHLMG